MLTGTVAAQNSGPAVVLSFVLAGVASIFAALCYAEFASLVPMAGSAYTYGYATLGEFIAWIIGWDLVLEYALGAVTVAIGWSGYVVSFLHGHRHRYPGPASARRTGARSPWPMARTVDRDLQPPRGHHHRDRHGAARGRHQGVGQRQQRDRLRQSRGGADLHRRRDRTR